MVSFKVRSRLDFDGHSSQPSQPITGLVVEWVHWMGVFRMVFFFLFILGSFYFVVGNIWFGENLAGYAMVSAVGGYDFSTARGIWSSWLVSKARSIGVR